MYIYLYKCSVSSEYIKKFSKYIVLANVFFVATRLSSAFVVLRISVLQPMEGSMIFVTPSSRNIEESRGIRLGASGRSHESRRAGPPSGDADMNPPTRFICRSGSWRSSTVCPAARIRRAGTDPGRDCANDDARRRGITASMDRNSRRTTSVSAR